MLVYLQKRNDGCGDSESWSNLESRKWQQINIWSDLWPPREVTQRPIIPNGRNLLTKVEELIDHGCPAAAMDFLGGGCLDNLRAVPVHGEMEDVVGWHYGSKGCFSV